MTSSPQDIQGVMPCLVTLLVLVLIVLTIFPYVFSYVMRSDQF